MLNDALISRGRSLRDRPYRRYNSASYVVSNFVQTTIRLKPQLCKRSPLPFFLCSFFSVLLFFRPPFISSRSSRSSATSALRPFLPESVRPRTSRSPKLKSLSLKAIIDIADPLVPEAFTGFEPFPGVLRPSPFRCPESFRMSRNKQKEI